ncbi:MAG: polysaccharide biosynthesis tyrosine autokinase [Bacteroidota bacterium]|nr:polysaccharide biosynthesis tyrosine autokinase [Bacteroidota bacterium]
MENDKHNGITAEQQEETINFREVVEKYMRYWKFILISVIVIVVLAFLYLQSKAPVYESTAMVIVEDDESGSLSGKMNAFSDLGLITNNANLYNEIEVFKSRQLITEVVRKLDLFYSIKQERNLLNADKLYYDNTPVTFSSNVLDSCIYDKNLEYQLVIIDDNRFALEETIYKQNSEEIVNDKGEHKFSDTINTSEGKIHFSKTQFWNESCIGEKFIIRIHGINAAVKIIKQNLVVETINKDASVIQLKIHGPIKSKNNDILNTLIKQHEAQAIRYKNEITRNTSEFIDERMKLIEKELFNIEETGESFKIKNKLVNVEMDAEMMMGKESNAEASFMKTYIQLQLARHIKNYMDKHPGYENLLPANLGLENQAVNEMTMEYNKLVLERNSKLINSSAQNPLVAKLEKQLASIKNSLSASLTNLIEGLELELQTIREKEEKYSSKLSRIPAFEREYREIMRQQQIKETLYLYLMQKREENEIAMASTVGNVKVVDHAYSSLEPIAPKKKLIMLGAFLVGLFLPIAVIYVIDMLDTKVHSIDDIESLNIPVAGNIPLCKGKKMVVVKQHGQTIIAEAFRMLRSNIDFLLNGIRNKEKGNVIFVTSTIAGEGKTFISLNLANSFTLTNHKVLLLGLDMRVPMIAQYLHMKENKGVSDYLNDENTSIDDIIVQSQDNENLHYITAGVIPPNPSELLMRPRLAELFDQLKKEYDYIIVDNAPIALVVDTLSIINYADLVIYVVRANYLDKRALDLPENLVKTKKIKHMAGVLNASSSAFSTYHGYGYYRYGYGQQKDSKWKNIKQWFNFGKK